MILLTDAISQSSNFCWIVLDETTYYISAFAVDSNGTIIDVQGKQITTDFYKFVPSSNTLAYYQLNSTKTTTDESGNGKNLSNMGSTTFTNVGGVSCAKFIASSNSGLYNNSVSVPQGKNAWTINMFLYPTQLNTGSSDENDLFFIGTGERDKGFLVYKLNPISLSTWGTALSSSNNLSINTWYNLVITQSNGTYKIYLNSNLIYTGTMSNTNIYGTRLNIGFAYGNGQSAKAFVGGISRFIFEKGEWNSSTISKYFKKYKSLYGLS